MFARVVEFSPRSEAAADFTRAVEGTVLRIVRAQAGCIAAYLEVRGRIVVGTSVWESASAAQRYSRECYPTIEKMLRPWLTRNPTIRTFDEAPAPAMLSDSRAPRVRTAMPT